MSKGFTQTVAEKLSSALKQLENDEQFRHSIVGICVADTKTGKLIFEKNSQVGLSPASCQKVVTSAAAFEFFGKSYTYKTQFSYSGEIAGGVLNGSLYIQGSGDPTLGSWRWNQTKEKVVLDGLLAALAKKSITSINGNVYALSTGWDTNVTPDGWTWEDMGNYYGAGAMSLNWRENQYDITLRSGDLPGEKVSLVKTDPQPVGVSLINELTTGKKGSGDNAYIYLPSYATKGFIRGTIPAGAQNFVISGSLPDPENQLISTIRSLLKQAKILAASELVTRQEGNIIPSQKLTPLYSIQSPTLDSINYWFLKRSVNLYGEAFVKSIAFAQKNYGATDTGIAVIREFWSKRGIDKASLKIVDGSGLSPANRVSAQALVTVMQYAKQQNWFSSFYLGLPEMNGIKMKDGYIGGVRSYTGFVKSAAGIEYTFAFIANNFDGSPGTVREKMWKILNLLK
ncbi:MAG: D-alanyl-D-alanine carboxypeptidase/D-alanyl-D-alanine-endopeptidase [Ferruginibacter sp.]|nr:D-alanyl-D-alanine carboxypeptidase/D-alanyl-D-alanine-endopeptidase [Ferruginibacter sp.]